MSNTEPSDPWMMSGECTPDAELAPIKQPKRTTYYCDELGLDPHAALLKQPDAEVEAAAIRMADRWGYRAAKRVVDFSFSILVLVVFSWLFILIALLIKIEDPRGPVFFIQKREGRLLPSGEHTTFKMYKFRTMCVDAEDKLVGLTELNEKTGPVFKMREDPRVTHVGKWLRKLSFDELPQFFNVLLGDLSIVGPRPALPKEVALYDERQVQRLLAKPGITCYWQTRKNRDAITFDEWVNLDLLYIKSASAWSDFKLLVQTIGVVLTAQGS